MNKVFLEIISIRTDKKYPVDKKKLLTETFNFVSGEHQTLEGGTTKPNIVLLIQRFFEKFLDWNILRTKGNFGLKIRILHQENMILEEVARQSRPLSVAPDTGVHRKIFGLEYLGNEREFLGENSDFVSGEHDNRRGGTTKSVVQRCSRYRGFLKNL